MSKNEYKAMLIKDRENVRASIAQLEKSKNDKLMTQSALELISQKLKYARAKEKELTEQIRSI